MQQEISTQAKGEMDKSQREYFLRQQLKAIQKELGEGDDLDRGGRRATGERPKEAELLARRRPTEAEKQLKRLSACTPTRPRPRSSAPTSTG